MMKVGSFTERSLDVDRTRCAIGAVIYIFKLELDFRHPIFQMFQRSRNLYDC